MESPSARHALAGGPARVEDVGDSFTDESHGPIGARASLALSEITDNSFLASSNRGLSLGMRAVVGSFPSLFQKGFSPN